MAQIVKLRRSAVSGQKPTNSNLQLGELALNTSDGKIFLAVSGALSATVEEAIVTNAQNTGSINLSGSIRLNGTESVTGSVIVNGKLQVTGDTSLTTLVVSGADPVANVQAFVPSSSVYNNADFNTPDRVASGIRFNWSNENWTIGAARGLTTDIDGLVFSRNGERNLLLHESGDMYLTGALRVTGSLYLNGQVVGTGKLNESDFNNYTSSVSSQFAGTSSFALTASHALNAVILDGQTKTQNFSSPSTTWSFNHQMGERYPSITVFDSDGYVVIPSEIHAIDDNNLNVYFPSNQTGLISVTVGGAGTAGTSGTSGSSGTSGANGSSGTSGTSGATGTSGSDGSSGTSGSSGSSGTSGRDGIGGKSETFASATTWSVFHNLDERYPVVNVWDSFGRVVIPTEIKSIDNNNLDIYFSSAQSGSVNIVKGGHLVSGAVDLSTALNGSNVVSSSVQITNLGFATTGSNTFKGDQTFSGSLIPVGSGSYDLGSVSNPFRHLYLSSASLYIDGQKVLGSTNQELQITTDNGQSIKILESGTDTITFQTADGDIQLKSSGGGNILIDPTNGLVDVRGTVQIQDGQKITSSGGNNVVFGNGIVISGSILSTTTPLISGSAQLTSMGYASTGSNTFTGNQTVNGNLTIGGNLTAQQFILSSSVLYVTESFASGSHSFGDTLDDYHNFTGSVNISGSLLINGTSYTAATSGTSGTSGSNGSSGTSGTSGSSGSSGTSGTSGSSGSSGTSGTSGSSGSSGTSGSSGSSGTSGTSVSVSGTNNTLVKFTSASTVGNSSITDSGTVVSLTTNMNITGSIIPGGATGTYDLGSATARWGTIYTSDLSLNNGIGNWTIVEGEDDLFLYNNKKGKVYKFALIEVDPSVATPKKSD
jgi:collagen type VII alpha